MMKINSKLRDVYQPYLKGLKEATKKNAHDFSYPLLMKAFPEYLKANKKILFVGKETYGWCGETMKNSRNLTVDYLTDFYEQFAFAYGKMDIMDGKSYSGKGSPFWRFVWEFHQAVNKTEDNGFLWTNFSKCDCGGTTPNKKLQTVNYKGFELILEEIKIIKPDIVLFLTGWSYENQFQRVFNPLEYETIDVNFLYRCIHKYLPVNSFMTTHPNYLNYKGAFHSVIKQIIKNIS